MKTSESKAARSSTATLIKALDILSQDIQSDDGVANAAIAEASQRLKELDDALDCVVVNCNYLHHDRRNRHKYGEPCPVEALLRNAQGNQ